MVTPSLAEQIRLMRGAESQRAFARRAGLSTSTVADAERGEPPSAETLRKIAAASGGTFAIDGATDIGHTSAKRGA